jgi:hypothetical protein
MKKLLVALVALLTIALAATPAAALQWHTANQATVAWDAVTADADGDPIPAGFEVRYKVFLVNSVTDPDKTNPSEISPAGGVTTLEHTFTLGAKGMYFVGAKAFMVEISSGEEVAESNQIWSDVPADCQGGQDFGIRYFANLGNFGGLRPVSP